MLIRKIRLKNIHSIRTETEINFGESPLHQCGLFAITGETGAGKTTILDAITLALYGNVCRTSAASRSDNYESLSIGAKSGYAECEFETVDGSVYLAQWTMTRRIKRNGEEESDVKRILSKWNPLSGEFDVLSGKIRELTAITEELTGLDFNRFTRSVLLAQGEFAAFLKADPNERSELLERITGTSIYSDISKATLAKLREEEKKMDLIETLLHSMQILTTDELNALSTSAEHLRTEVKEHKSSIQELSNSLDWINQTDKLNQQLKAAVVELEKITEEEVQLDPDKRRLETHNNALPLKAEWMQLLRTQTDLTKNQDSFLTNKTEVERIIALLNEQRTALAERKQLFEKHQDRKEEVFTLVAQVRKIDQELQNQKEKLAQLETDLEMERVEQDKRATHIEIKARAVIELESKIASLETWLRDNAGLSELFDKVPLIDSKMSELDALRSRLVNLEKERSELKTKQAQENDALKLVTESRAKLSGDLEQLRSELKEKSEGAFLTDPTEFLNNLTAQLDDLTEKKIRLNSLSEQDQLYRKNIAEEGELSQKLKDLYFQEQELNKALLNLFDELAEADEILSFKRTIYNQQQRIASYQKDRSELKDGEQCPLCGAVHHPYLQHGVKVYEDTAKLEFEKAQEMVDALKSKEKKILVQLNGVVEILKSLSNPQHTGSLDRIRAEIEKQERQIAESIGEFDFTFSFLPGKDLLSERIRDMERALTDKRQLRDYFQQKLQVYSELSKQYEEQERKYLMCLNEVMRLSDSAESMTLRKNELGSSIDQISLELNELTATFKDGAEGELMTRITKLKSQIGVFTEKKEQRASLNQELSSSKTEIALLRKQMEERSKILHDLTLKHKESNQQVEEKLKERKNLFEDKDPDTEQGLWQEQFDLLKEQVFLSEKEIGTNDQKLQSLQALQNSLEKLMAESAQELENLETGLKPRLQELGFSDVSSFSSAILNDPEKTRIEENLAALAKRRIKAEQEQEKSSKELAELSKTSPVVTDALLLKGQLKEQEHRQEKCLQELGGVEEQIRQDSLNRTKAGQLEAQRKQHQKTLQRWKDLNELIGSHDGKKFRVFAQSLTLQRLVFLANQQLAHLYDRYRIVKRQGTDLDLDIVDQYQADSVRSLFSLSGGESFLVSLALALGLSDLAGRSAHIRSLFIDEGFGSLDEQTLDMAISTLENLQAGGKTIGIISHVKELKERITTQIRVVKKNNGVSVVEVVGW